MNPSNYTRLTDSLERELLQQAIDAQYQYPTLDKVFSNLFRKVASFFRGPEVTIQRTNTAH